MVNRKVFCLVFGIILAVGLILAGCDNPADSGNSNQNGNNNSVSVPSWAQGTWYTASSGAGRIKTVLITSSQYIAFQVTGYDGSYKPIVSELLRIDCTSVSGDTVTFGGTGGLQVKKLSSSDQISIGTQGVWITIYK